MYSSGDWTSGTVLRVVHPLPYRLVCTHVDGKFSRIFTGIIFDLPAISTVNKSLTIFLLLAILIICEKLGYSLQIRTKQFSMIVQQHAMKKS